MPQVVTNPRSATIARLDPALATTGPTPEHSAGGRHTYAVECFRECTESVFTALFAGGLLDQVALPAVAAGVEATGRVRNDPAGRAARTAASEQLIFLADDHTRRREATRLLQRHQDVRGIGYNGVRYSALNPESWNWILYSTFLMHRGATQAITGVRFDEADDQAIWSYFLELADPLQLPGQGRLPATYAELLSDYERIVREKCGSNITLDGSLSALQRPVAPRNLPFVVRKVLWPLPMSVAGEVACVLGLGTLHPEIRELTRVPWTRRRQIEYRLLTTVIRLAHTHLPRRMTMTPLARNRRDYEGLVERYEGLALDSFAVAETPGRCPIGR